MSSSQEKNKRTKVTFLHLDLGIGGAERLVVDAAKQCMELGYQVQIYTTHHDITHCFPETLEKDKRASFVRVFGDWLPRYVDVSLFTTRKENNGGGPGTNSTNRRFIALCGIIRMLYLAMVFIVNHIFTWKDETAVCDAHVVFLDGLSAPIPLLSIFGFPVLFYCHFPDRYLSPINLEQQQPQSNDNGGIVAKCKRFYRDVVDLLEDISMAQATIIAVNSEFTASVCRESFSFLKQSSSKLVTIYPAVNCTTGDKDDHGSGEEEEDLRLLSYCKGYKNIFVSLNRYERKKKLELAVTAFKDLIGIYGEEKAMKESTLLVISGGYDEALEENSSYYQELVSLVDSLGLNDVVVFRRSISNDERVALLRKATALLYTPDREHFGIVPIEAMSLGTAVIAVASGGPLETIQDGVTGYLVEQDSQKFADAMYKILSKSNHNQEMGKAGKDRVKALFSTDALGSKLEHTIDQVIKTHGKPGLLFLTSWVVVLIMIGQGLGYVLIHISKVLQHLFALSEN